MKPRAEHIASDTRCTQCGGTFVPLSVHKEVVDKYMKLLESVANSGLALSDVSSKVDRYRAAAIVYLRQHHRHVTFKPKELDDVPSEIQQECRAHLQYVFGSGPDVMEGIKDVFRPRKKSKAKSEEKYFLPRY
ncbi:MAG: hypothetical protein ABI623_11485 [bacterium]